MQTLPCAFNETILPTHHDSAMDLERFKSGEPLQIKSNKSYVAITTDSTLRELSLGS